MTGKKKTKKKTAAKAPESPKIKAVKQAGFDTVLRSEIHLPDYNPRKIDGAAADKLRKQIREDGLVDTIVINKRTMNVVGGNQRTAQLDKIYKYVPGQSDYKINVQTIDVDERTEIRINARLNNPDAAGEYDASKVLQLVTDFEMDPLKDMNFDRDTFDIFVNESGFDNPLDDITEIIKDVRKTSNDTGLPQEPKSSLQNIKKTDMEKREEENTRGNSEYMEKDDYILTIVFNSNQEKWSFLEKIGKPSKEKFIKGSKLRDIVKPEYL